LVFGFHGRGGAGSQANGLGINAAAKQAGKSAIFMFPYGLDQGGGTGWNEKKDGPDVALFDALLDFAKSTYCIDESRVFVAGFSWGNDFSNTLGCYRGDRIRAINGFSGGLYNNDCGSVTPAYRATYSTPDGTDAYSQAAIDKAVNHYKTALGCQDSSAAVLPSPCKGYQGCMKPVIFCGYPNMGHAVPPTGGKDAWEFFASFQ
jgi:poly(3-hydroxybutyrate) depolymerase